jgi:hypothetical protein
MKGKKIKNRSSTMFIFVASKMEKISIYQLHQPTAKSLRVQE